MQEKSAIFIFLKFLFFKCVRINDQPNFFYFQAIVFLYSYKVCRLKGFKGEYSYIKGFFFADKLSLATNKLGYGQPSA